MVTMTMTKYKYYIPEENVKKLKRIYHREGKRPLKSWLFDNSFSFHDGVGFHSPIHPSHAHYTSVSFLSFLPLSQHLLVNSQPRQVAATNALGTTMST